MEVHEEMAQRLAKTILWFDFWSVRFTYQFFIIFIWV